VLLTNRINTSLLEAVDLVTISYLERSKYSNIIRLELVRGIGGEAT